MAEWSLFNEIFGSDSNKRLFLPEKEIDVEKYLSTKGITPAAEEEGTNYGEEMVNYALIYLNIHNGSQKKILLLVVRPIRGGGGKDRNTKERELFLRG